MTPDHERWAEALAVEREHGEYCQVHIATRIGELATAGDLAGVARWRAIAARIDLLRRRGAVN